VYVSYGHAGGQEEVMIEFREFLDSLIGSSTEEYVEWIDKDLIDLRKLVPRFESYRDSWTQGNAPGYAFRLADAAHDIGANLLMPQAADRTLPTRSARDVGALLARDGQHRQRRADLLRERTRIAERRTTLGAPFVDDRHTH
jgi:hypothetical protein